MPEDAPHPFRDADNLLSQEGVDIRTLDKTTVTVSKMEFGEAWDQELQSSAPAFIVQGTDGEGNEVEMTYIYPYNTPLDAAGVIVDQMIAYSKFYEVRDLDIALAIRKREKEEALRAMEAEESARKKEE